MTLLLAIDPGPTESAYVLYDTEAAKPTAFAKLENHWLRSALDDTDADEIVIEMIDCYGMPVGAETFETCVVIGALEERWRVDHFRRPPPRRIKRREVKLHLCGSARAKDPNVRQALIDRYGGKETAIGRKASPGPLYGVSGGVWAALAVAVTFAETHLHPTPAISKEIHV